MTGLGWPANELRDSSVSTNPPGLVSQIGTTMPSFFMGAEDLTPDACMAGISSTEPRPQSTLGHTVVVSASWDTGT